MCRFHRGNRADRDNTPRYPDGSVNEQEVWGVLAGEAEFQRIIVEGLLEFLKAQGLPTTSSSLWEARTWSGVPFHSVAIGIRVTDEGWRVCPFAGVHDVIVPFEEPMEAILEVVERVREWERGVVARGGSVLTVGEGGGR